MNSKYAFKSLLFRIQMRFIFKQTHFKTCIAFRVLIALYTIDLYVVFIPQSDSLWNKTVSKQTIGDSGWVVTWFLLGYTVRMFEYTVRTFWSNVGRFLYVFSSIPRKLYTIFQPTFSPIKRYQDSIFKLLTLSTNSVTNVVRTAYFQIQARSSPLKILWQSLYSK